MADQPSIFGTNPEATPQTPAGTAPANVQIDAQIATLLSEIKNERGEPKYKTLQDAIVALKHSQEYIPTLSSKLQQTENDLATARAAAANVDELRRSVEALTQREAPQAQQGQAGLTPEQIAELVNQGVSRTLTQREQEQVVQANTSSVANALRAAYGANVETKYAEKAAELGMTVVELNALAAKSPKAVLGMFGAKSVTPQGVPQSTVNTAALQPHQETFVSRNREGVPLGATIADMRKESAAAAKMVDELHAQGRSVHDLTDPKVYFKTFGQ